MTDFKFLSADGTTNFTLRTDFIGASPSTENLTVCDIYVKADPNHYADFFQKIKYNVGELREKAVEWAIGLTSESIAKPGIAAINQVLQPPADFEATADSDTQITLDWSKSPGATGYVITRSTSVSFSTGNTVVTVGDVATSEHTGLTAETQYYFRIQAIKDGVTGSAYAYADAETDPAG